MSDISIKLDPAVVEEAARSISQNAQPAPARYGSLGGCCSCHESIFTHFDTAGRFLGCTAVPEGTVFVMMAVPARAGAGRTALTKPQQQTDSTPPPSPPVPAARPEIDPAPSALSPQNRAQLRQRRFQRTRYFLTQPLEDLSPHVITPLQRELLQALAGIKNPESSGFTASDIATRLHVPNNTAQAAIRWMKKRKAVREREDHQAPKRKKTTKDS